MYFVLLCILMIGLTEARQTNVYLPAKLKSIMMEKAPGCIEKTGADSEILQRLFQWKFPSNDISKKFHFCLFKNVGLSDDAGRFYVDKVLDLYEYSDQKDEIAKASTECNKVVAENPFETMYQILECFHAKSPVVLNVKLE